MKTRSAFLLVTFLLPLVSLSAQVQGKPGETYGTYWALGAYGTDMAALETSLDTALKNGLVPVALEVYPDQGLNIMYLRNFSKEIPKARIDRFEQDKLSAGLNTLMKSGWLPHDVCFRASTAFVLSLGDTITAPVQGAIHRVPPKQDALGAKLKELAKDGYLPQGISFDGDEFWIFSLNDPRSPFKDLSVRVYPNNGTALFSGVDDMIKDKYSPIGFTTTPMGIYVVYTR